jgi:hypothetical protein
MNRVLVPGSKSDIDDFRRRGCQSAGLRSLHRVNVRNSSQSSEREWYTMRPARIRRTPPTAMSKSGSTVLRSVRPARRAARQGRAGAHLPALPNSWVIPRGTVPVALRCTTERHASFGFAVGHAQSVCSEGCTGNIFFLSIDFVDRCVWLKD